MDMYEQDGCVTHMNAPGPPDNAAQRIRAIAAGLTAAGITAGTHGNNITGLDVTASSQPPGQATTEIMLDEDGYAEIRWYTNPNAPAADITTALTRILAAITPTALAPRPAHLDDALAAADERDQAARPAAAHRLVDRTEVVLRPIGMYLARPSHGSSSR